MTEHNLKSATTLSDEFAQFYSSRHSAEPMTVLEYLEEAKTNHKLYQSSHAALVEAFGEPEILDTRNDPRLSRIHENRLLRIFKPFEGEFFGMYEVIESIYSYALRASQGFDERHKILYLLGPVGGGKSSLAEKLKQMMETVPFYSLAFMKGDGTLEMSPVYESPLGLFSESGMREKIVLRYGIPSRVFPRVMSPWAAKRLTETRSDPEGPLARFRVVKLFPSTVGQVGIAVATPGDDTNQDTSTLVGKTDIRMLEQYSQSDPDAYSFSGALCRGQRMMEFVEMFKAPIKTLNPLLPATMENYFTGTESIGGIPFHGIILAHSNEAEWEKFKNNKQNEAFIDRISLVKVPYIRAVSDEIHVYEKLIKGSSLADHPCAPGTLEVLSTFFVLTRLAEHANSSWLAKLQVYDGKNIKDTDPKAKPLHEYRDAAGVNEGMTGQSTRFAFEVLAKTYNADATEIAADPVHLLWVLENEIRQRQLPNQDLYLGTFLKEICVGQMRKKIEDIIRECYLDSGDEFGQAMYERYLILADHWVDDKDYRDPDTGEMFDREMLNRELEGIEKPAGIANPKDFRNEVTRYSIRYKATHGKYPPWRAYEKMRQVIEKKMFANVEDMLPIISFTKKESVELEEKHRGFIERMTAKGFTEKQTRRLVEWHLRSKQK